MKVWIVCVLLCATFTLRTAAAVAIDTETKQDQKLPVEDKEETLKAEAASEGETTELAVKELSDAVEDEEEVLQGDLPTKVKSAFCPSGWVKYRFRCFRLMRSSVSWLNAEAQCANVQARLASVHSLGEYNFLQSVLDMAGLSHAWIGAYHFQGAWLWVDTTRFTYTNWYSLSSASSYSCAFMRNNVGWCNANCGSAYAYFCAIDLNTC